MLKVVSDTGYYRLPDLLAEELDLYRLEVERFQRGEVSDGAFKAFRVPRGIYSQRGGQTYMVRLRVPAGGLTPIQMEAIADLSERHGDGTPHVTSRQGVQVHGVRIEETAALLRELANVSLTTWGGGGNTIRNITACAESGVCPEEAFDVTPHAVALSERLMADPRSGVLPRKFKIAFSGCGRDCARATVNDLGFVAKIRTEMGREQRGFAVYGAGGMGAHSRVADLLEEFIPESEVHNVAEAVLRIFDRMGDRENRHRARLRFVAERVGIEEFRRIYHEELRQVRDVKTVPLALREPCGQPAPVSDSQSHKRNSQQAEPPDMGGAVRPQRQADYYCAEVHLALGLISSQQLSDLAALVRRFGDGTVRTTHGQNILIRWLRQEEVRPLRQALEEIGLPLVNALGTVDVLSCAGASTCNPGICLSRNLAAEIAQTLGAARLPQEVLGELDVRVSGCPNACGQHPIASIGLHGLARRCAGRPAPHYRVLLGGRTREGGTRLGQEAGVVPASRVPELLHTFATGYVASRHQGETLHEFLDRRGRRDMEALIQEREDILPEDEAPDLYVDVRTSESFSLAGLGAGECGAGVRDLIESDIEEAGRYLRRAQRRLHGDDSDDAADDCKRALSLAARALLATRGRQPEGSSEAYELFRAYFVETGLVPERYMDIAERAERMSAKDLADGDGFEYVGLLIERVRTLHGSMDAARRFLVSGETGSGEMGEEPAAEPGDGESDLR